ncbi:peptide deformylase [Leptodesmis sichuanensis]|uniref:peptide deformylase n=1 Tax=Leptodesmis sichuanensis TaxID=2906798 RepID=UPI001F365AE4|nr:peptide deformylase [Leptodesmis sichuanensis]UIE37612.1 peptide deformylase [Leptodesmis sichuanensis A121]
MTRLQVMELGHPVLRRVAKPITEARRTSLQPLMDQLIQTAQQANGVGIAAPQVGISERLFIVASRPTPRYPHAPVMEPTVMINPQIVSHSAERVKDWEGCLSVPGVRGLVPRYQAIAVEYTDRYGQHQHQELTDFVARIFQHELDHLNGILFIDRVESTQDLISEQDYQERIVGASWSTEK